MRYTYVMLTSLFENQPKDLDIHIYLLQSDLTDEDKATIVRYGIQALAGEELN